jgi:hypothetical protein
MNSHFRVDAQLHGTYNLIDGAGHYPHAEMPEVTSSSILSFLPTLNNFIGQQR